MKLEVGMYVRTKTGIEQIYMIDNNKTKYKYLFKLKKQDGDGSIDCGVLSSEDIIKEPSFEIIDLIEEGDYVNGYKVKNINRGIVYATTFDWCDLCNDFERIEIKDIKSIVTKEQFEAMQYEIK